MPAYRLSFDLNFENLFAQSTETDPARQAEMMKAFVQERLLEGSRKLARAQMRETDRSNLPQPAKSQTMAEHMRTIMLAVMAEANLAIEALPEGHAVETRLPYEEPADDV